MDIHIIWTFTLSMLLLFLLSLVHGHVLLKKNVSIIRIHRIGGRKLIRVGSATNNLLSVVVEKLLG